MPVMADGVGGKGGLQWSPVARGLIANNGAGMIVTVGNAHPWNDLESHTS